MEFLPTFENYSGPMIATVETRSGEFIVTGLSGRSIIRRSIAYGEILVGFSTDLIVTKRGNEIFTFTPEFRQISRFTLGSTDEVRGVIGPNILIFRKTDNSLITFDRNFKRLASYSTF